MAELVGAREFARCASSAAALDALLDRYAPLVLIDLDDGAEPVDMGVTPLVVVGVTAHPDRVSPEWSIADVIVSTSDDSTIDGITSTVRSNPLAATALVLLLRGAHERTLTDALITESATYSMLQSGPEFWSWRSANPPRVRAEGEGPTVRIGRVGDLLEVTLARPDVRNALNATMRDELYDALNVAAADPSLRIRLTGEGPAFCSGGDLDEFGTRPDPTSAHLLRLRRSVGLCIAHLGARIEVQVHGACRGSGVELPAFAHRVVARSDATFGLPEVALGLVPGAGGTASIPRRIGRWRTAELALSGRAIDAPTALSWGLVDAVVD